MQIGTLTHVDVRFMLLCQIVLFYIQQIIFVYIILYVKHKKGNGNLKHVVIIG